MAGNYESIVYMYCVHVLLLTSVVKLRMSVFILAPSSIADKIFEFRENSEYNPAPIKPLEHTNNNDPPY